MKATEMLLKSNPDGRLRQSPRSPGLCRPKPSLSIRVPLTPNNREYLRALRAAELAHWEPLVELRTTPQAQGHKLSLRAPMVDLQQEQTKEFRLYAVIAPVALGAVGVGLWNSFQMVQKWTTFVDFVARWIG